MGQEVGLSQPGLIQPPADHQQQQRQSLPVCPADPDPAEDGQRFVRRQLGRSGRCGRRASAHPQQRRVAERGVQAAAGRAFERELEAEVQRAERFLAGEPP